MSWQRIWYGLSRRQYPDTWLWAAWALLGALFWGVMSVAALSSGLVTRSSTGLCVSACLIISALAMFFYRAWGWLLAALVCLGLAVWFGAGRSYELAAFHLFYAALYWNGYRQLIPGHPRRSPNAS